MRHARSKRRVEHVDVDRDVHRTVDRRHRHDALASLVDLDAEALGLRPLVWGHGANPELDETGNLALLHDPSERARMGIPIAVELVVEIRMRIEMQEREAVMFTGHRLDERPGDEMIAADRDQPTTVGDRICGRLPDNGQGRLDLLGEIEIAEVPPGGTLRRVEIDPPLGAPVGGSTIERRPDRRWSTGRAAKKRRVRVVRDTEQRNGGHRITHRHRSRASRRARNQPTAARRARRLQPPTPLARSRQRAPGNRPPRPCARVRNWPDH